MGEGRKADGSGFGMGAQIRARAPKEVRVVTGWLDELDEAEQTR
jgi:hypothetical protein